LAIANRSDTIGLLVVGADLDTENDPWGTTKDIDVLHRSSVTSRTGEHRDAIEEPYADIFSAKYAMVVL
jgi:hypothetical protein